MGIELVGTDLSTKMMDRCRNKAKTKKLLVELHQCDFRNISSFFNRKFDCVASTGNSLPYVNNTELLDVIEQMDSLVNVNGYIYIDTRNWDKILSEKNRFWLYNPTFIDEKRINCIQVWDYNPDKSIDFNILYTFEENNIIIHKEEFKEHYFPISRDTIINKLIELNYVDISIMRLPAFIDYNDIEALDWYCIIAQKR